MIIKYLFKAHDESTKMVIEWKAVCKYFSRGLLFVIKGMLAISSQQSCPTNLFRPDKQLYMALLYEQFYGILLPKK